MSHEDEARAQLAEFARQLRRLTRQAEDARQRQGLEVSPSLISPDLVERFVGGIERYLNGDVATLENAFKMKKRGAPGYPERNRRLAQLIYPLREHEDKAWPEVYAEVSATDEFKDLDEREMRQAYYAYFSEIAAPEIARDVLANLEEE